MPYHVFLWYVDEMKSQNIPPTVWFTYGFYNNVVCIYFFFLAQTKQESLNINT